MHKSPIQLVFKILQGLFLWAVQDPETRHRTYVAGIGVVERRGEAKGRHSGEAAVLIAWALGNRSLPYTIPPQYRNTSFLTAFNKMDSPEISKGKISKIRIPSQDDGSFILSGCTCKCISIW